jgi:tripartite-type tricarboxylate transporter receptor subunit TctC
MGRLDVFKILMMLVAVLGIVRAEPAFSQAWPQKPVRILVITPPGGFPDFAARTIADQMGPILGQQVVVENRPGGAGNIAAAAVANAEPDGYTILLTGNNHPVNATLVPNPGFDYIRSFAPVGLIATSNMLLVASAEMKANSLSEVLELARKKPGSVTLAVTQIGTPGHLGAELLLQQTKTDMLLVPYTGVAPALPDLVSGRTDLVLSAFPAVMPMIQAGKLKALAVTRAQRSPMLADVPTVAESGVPGYDLYGWICLLAPAGTPPAVIEKLNGALRQALGKPEVREAFAKQGIDVAPSSPAELSAMMETEARTWAKVLAQAKVK